MINFKPGIDLPEDAAGGLPFDSGADRNHPRLWPHARSNDDEWPRPRISKIQKKLDGSIRVFKIHIRTKDSEDNINRHWSQFIDKLARDNRCTALAACYYTILGLKPGCSLHNCAVAKWREELDLLAAENFSLAVEIAEDTCLATFPNSPLESEAGDALKLFNELSPCLSCKTELQRPVTEFGALRLMLL